MTDTTDPRRAFVLAFRKSYQRWKEWGWGHNLSVTLALAKAEESVTLTPEQRIDVDGFLEDETEERAGLYDERPEVPFDFEVG